jgi:hypothetical protein
MKRHFLSLPLLVAASTFAAAADNARPTTQTSQTSSSRTNVPQVEIPTSNTISKISDSLLGKTQDLAEKLVQKPVTIRDLRGESGGTFVKLKWSRSHLCGDYGFISEQPIEVGYEEEKNLYISGPTVHSAVIGKDEEPEVVFPQLKPDRTYYCAILPTIYSSDSNLGIENAIVVPVYFEIRTMKRNVSLTVESILVIDDSDDLSDGDLAFTFQIAKPYVAISSADPDEFLDVARYPSSNCVHVDSGETVYPDKKLTALDVNDELKFAISCFDDDDDIFTASGAPLVVHDYQYLGTFDNNMGESNSKVWTLDVSGGTYESEPNVLSEYPQWYDYWQMETKVATFVRVVTASDESDLSYVVTLNAHIHYGE